MASVQVNAKPNEPDLAETLVAPNAVESKSAKGQLKGLTMSVGIPAGFLIGLIYKREPSARNPACRSEDFSRRILCVLWPQRLMYVKAVNR